MNNLRQLPLGNGYQGLEISSVTLGSHEQLIRVTFDHLTPSSWPNFFSSPISKNLFFSHSQERKLSCVFLSTEHAILFHSL